MTLTEREINHAAEFLAMTSEEERPCIVIGGVLIFAYFDEGVLHISTHYDTPEPSVVADDDTVPTEVNVGGEVVWSG